MLVGSFSSDHFLMVKLKKKKKSLKHNFCSRYRVFMVVFVGLFNNAYEKMNGDGPDVWPINV